MCALSLRGVMPPCAGRGHAPRDCSLLPRSMPKLASAGQEICILLPCTVARLTSLGPRMELPRSKILVVDDEPNVLLTVQAILQQEGYDVDAVGDGAAAVDIVRARHYDLVLTDLKMPGLDGFAVLNEVRKRSPDTVTVVMTGYGSVGSAVDAVQAGAYEYLIKPIGAPELKIAVRRALERKRFSEIDTLYRIGRTVTTSLEATSVVFEV